VGDLSSSETQTQVSSRARVIVTMSEAACNLRSPDRWGVSHHLQQHLSQRHHHRQRLLFAGGVMQLAAPASTAPPLAVRDATCLYSATACSTWCIAARWVRGSRCCSRSV